MLTRTYNIHVSKRPNFWKLKNSLIADTTLIEQMKLFFQEKMVDLVTNNSLSDQNKPKHFMYKVGSSSVAFSVQPKFWPKALGNFKRDWNKKSQRLNKIYLLKKILMNI